MSALNFILTEDQVIIAMDTLVINQPSGQPVKTVTKFLPVPHMNCIVCGTGNLKSIINWFSFIENKIIANGIYQLDKITDANLNDIIGEEMCGCTIYQFGLNEIDNKFYGYVYRQDNNYHSEQLNYGLGCKPTKPFLNEDGNIDLSDYLEILPESFHECLYKMMLRQKEYDDSLNIDERIGIGGMIQIAILSRNICSIENYKYFEDYEETYKKIIENL